MTDIIDLTNIINSLYDNNDPLQAAHKASQHDRVKLYNDSIVHNQHLIYGELSIDSIVHILDNVVNINNHNNNNNNNKTQYRLIDLGCGNSRILLTIAIKCYNELECCHGIELLPSLVELSTNALNKLQQQQQYNNIHYCNDIHIECNDILIYNWSQYNLIYINSTMFSTDLMYKITKLCERLPLNSYVITVTNKLHNSILRMFELIHNDKYSSSYGYCTVYVYKKVNNNRLHNVILRAFK